MNRSVLFCGLIATAISCWLTEAQTNYGTITFTNRSGVVIRDAVVKKIEAGKLIYIYSEGAGGGSVSLAELPEGLRARFGYVPDHAGGAGSIRSPAQQAETDERLKAQAEIAAQKAETDRKKFLETKAKAEMGDAQAQADLGRCYQLALGVPTDGAEALKWYQKAADQGNLGGVNGLGNCYYYGLGVATNQTEALKWFRKAADQGFAKAQLNVGVCYARGVGVAKDSVESVKWRLKAAEQGYAEAQFDLGCCYYNGLGVATNQTEARKWFRKAADQGFAPAQLNLGLCYQKGEGAAKDSVEAMKWFLKATENGDAQAQFTVGWCYARGDGVATNKTEAVKWYQKAADQGFLGAQMALAVCFVQGEGVPKDSLEACKWLEMASAQGDLLAKDTLSALRQTMSDELLFSVVQNLIASPLPNRVGASSSRPDLEILSLTTKVMESNDTWWRWSYQLKAKNNTDHSIHEFSHLLFLDAEGFIIETASCEVKLLAGETKTILDTTLVKLPGAARVKSIKIQ